MHGGLKFLFKEFYLLQKTEKMWAKKTENRIFILVLWLIAFAQVALGQSENSQQKRKSIEVTGSARIEITPDEIYFNITLKEYKSLGNKTNLQQLENQLVKVVKKLRIPEEDFQIENVAGYRNYSRKKEEKEFLAVKSYQIKLPNLNGINELLESLDPRGIQHTNIGQVSHSNIEAFKKDLKIQAIKAAKEKANYLLVSINEELGEALEIHEVGHDRGYPRMYRSARVSLDSSFAPEIDFKKIELEENVQVIFAIK